MSTNLGEIVYDVSMDVQQLLTSQRTLEQRLNRMESSFNSTSTAIDRTNKAMLSLSKVAVALTSYLSVQSVADYAEAWTTLNNKLSNSIREGESLVDVTERIFNISQTTRSSLDATATLYARLERGTRQYNTSAQDLAKLTTIINQGFIVSGATAQEAENAIIQLSQGIASGVLRGEEFNSVSEQGSRLMVALADSLGVGIGELRKMAAEGKLTTDVVVNGLLSQGDSIGKEFANTTQTMSQAMQEAGNNITKFFGESSTIKSFVSVFNDSVVTVSENLSALAGVLTLLASVLGSRFAGALAMAAKGKIQAAIESRNLAIAEHRLASSAELTAAANLRAASVAKTRALDEVKLAQQMRATATTADQVAAAEARLSAARRNAAPIVNRYNRLLSEHRLAQAEAAAAASRASITIGGVLRGALGLVGGPVGFAVLAASGLFYFSQKAQEARDSANSLADGVNGLIQKFKEMTRAQIGEEIGKANKQIPELEKSLKEAQERFDKLTVKIEGYNREIKRFELSSRRGREASEALNIVLNDQKIAAGELERAQQRLSQAKNFVTIATAKLNGEMLTGAELLSYEAKTLLPSGSAALRQYGVDLEKATRSKQKFNSQSLMLDYGGEKGEELKKKIERDLALSKLDGEAKVELQVRFAAEDAGITSEPAIQDLIDKEKEKYRNEKKKRETIKDTKKAASAAAKEATEAEKLQKKIADLANATKVAELETKGLSREAAILEAVQSLGSKASEKQIKEISELAGKEFDLKQAIKDREDAYKQNLGLQAAREQKLALEQLDRQLNANLVTEEQYQKRRAEINAEYSKKIAEENAKSVITPTQEMAGQLDPVQRLANENAQKLALTQEYVNQKVLTEEQGLALMNAANREYEQSRFDAMWGLWKGQNDLNNLMGTAIDSLSSGTATAVSAMLSGTQSAGDAMRNLANTALNAMVQQLMQMAVQALITRTILGTFMGGLGAIPNIASVASSVTSLSNIGGMGMPTDFRSYGGGRYNGGSVNPNSYYRFGEGGKPEILRTSSGKNYLLPGEGGKVIPNKDLQGGGSLPPIINVYQQASGATVDVSTEKGLNEQDVINIVVRSIAEGREVSGAMATYHNASRKALGGF
ncbi:TPA: tape measure protein [Providencia stuartii]|uniref:tape measure protein n=1 Tax=Providencia stuartii TaxID=588 RepID=UPI00123BED97|nr:tape measure protein [Providencia stuartii]QET99049.1 tape measure protein [Providencia stuartii]HEM8144922.1 tape measure protein [Providencia stuartii]HEM8875458.1 tape measure protein [Providencia stuartii]